jgi:hypothetical protein
MAKSFHSQEVSLGYIKNVIIWGFFYRKVLILDIYDLEYTHTHAELYFFDDGRLALMTYYAQPNAKLPVIPWDEELQTVAVGGEIEAGLLTEGLKNTFSDERLGWVAEK